MFKKILLAASCVAVLGGASAMQLQEDLVDNPIPLLVRAVSPTFLKGLEYEAVHTAFEESISKFSGECEKTMKISGFPVCLTVTWHEKLALLKETEAVLRSKGDITDVYKRLVAVTDDGFLTDSRVAISGTENSETCDKVLDVFWQNLWQARELTEYMFIISQKKVPSHKIPEICESVDRSVSGIRRSSSSEDVKKSAERIETTLNGALSAYQYMEFGKPVKTSSNLQRMQSILPEDEKLREIMLGVFDSIADD